MKTTSGRTSYRSFVTGLTVAGETLKPKKPSKPGSSVGGKATELDSDQRRSNPCCPSNGPLDPSAPCDLFKTPCRDDSRIESADAEAPLTAEHENAVKSSFATAGLEFLSDVGQA